MTKKKESSNSKKNKKANFKPKLKNLEIKNFRGIDYLKIDKLSKINIFVGRNGIGKTSILEAFSLLIEKDPNLINDSSFRISNRYRYRRSLVDDYLVCFHQLDDKKQILVSTKNNNNEKKITIDLIEEENKNDEEYYGPRNELEERNKKNLLLKFFENNNLKTEKSTNDIRRYRPRIRKKIRDNNELENKEFVENIRIESDFLIEQVEEIIKEGKKKELISFLSSINRHVKDFHLLSGDVFLEQEEIDKPFSIKYLGDGINKMLILYVAIFYNRRHYITIDEIENGLHYRSQEIAWKVLMEESAKNNTDLFITTHSYEMLQSLVKVLEQEENEKYRNLFSVHTLFKNPELNIISNDYDRFKEIMKDEKEIRGSL